MHNIVIIGNSHINSKIAFHLKRQNCDFVCLPGKSLNEDNLFKNYPYIVGDYQDIEFLKKVGIHKATCIIINSKNDEIDIYLALQVRELNPTVKLIIELNNDKLGKKIESEIENCYTISYSGLSASSFAAASIFRYAFFSLKHENEIYSFAKIPLELVKGLGNYEKTKFELDFGVKTLFYECSNNISDANDIVSIPDSGCLYIFGALKNLIKLKKYFPKPEKVKKINKPKSKVRTDKFLLYILLTMTILVSLSTLYFHYTEHLSWFSAFCLVLSSTLIGDNIDFSLETALWISKVINVILMLSGFVLMALLFAIITDYFIKKRENYLEGRHKYNFKDHIIICGLGSVGLKIINNLIELDQKILVIEKNKDNFLLNELEKRNIPYMIADASNELALIDANIQKAKSIICAINGDLTALEIALTARSLNHSLRVVLRIFDECIAQKIQKYFHIHIALSASALCSQYFVSQALDDRIITVVPISNNILALAVFEDTDELPNESTKLVQGSKNLVCFPLKQFKHKKFCLID